jgi:hypothetical protein
MLQVVPLAQYLRVVEFETVIFIPGIRKSVTTVGHKEGFVNILISEFDQTFPFLCT